MDERLPDAKSTPRPNYARLAPLSYSYSRNERDKLQRIIAERGLGGLANDTKWNELITAMRSRNWRPSYRFKCIDGHASRWDVEWRFYHLPCPFLSVEWLDIARLQEVTIHRLPQRIEIIDHSTWIEPLLRQIGLDYRVGSEMILHFWLLPARDLELF